MVQVEQLVDLYFRLQINAELLLALSRALCLHTRMRHGLNVVLDGDSCLVVVSACSRPLVGRVATIAARRLTRVISEQTTGPLKLLDS